MRRLTWITMAVCMGLALASFAVMGRKTERGIQLLTFAQLPLDRVDEIVMSKPDSVVLKKNNLRWWAPTGRPADIEQVMHLLATLQTLRSTDLVTTDHTRYADFAVDHQQGNEVTLKAAGQIMQQLVIGKSTHIGGFVRVEDKVYQVSGLNPAWFAKSSVAWQDLWMVRTPISQIARINVALRGQQPYTLIFDKPHWKLMPTDVVGEFKISEYRFKAHVSDALAQTIATLRATEILSADPGADITELDAPADHITLFVMGQDSKITPHQLFLGATGPQGVYARLENKSDIFIISIADAGRLRQSLNDLFDRRLLLDVVTHLLNHIEIKTPKQQLTLDKYGDAWLKEELGKPETKEMLTAAQVEPGLQAALHIQSKHGLPAKASEALLHPVQTTILLRHNNNTQAKLMFGKVVPERQAVYVQDTFDSEIYEVDAAAYTQLLASFNF